MRVVQLLRVLEVYLQDPAFLRVPVHLHYLLLRGHDTLPMEITLWQRQTHCPAINVVRVKIGYVVCRFCGVLSFNLRVVRFCVPFAHHRDAAPHPPLDEQVHVQICQQLQLDSCLL